MRERGIHMIKTVCSQQWWTSSFDLASDPSNYGGYWTPWADGDDSTVEIGQVTSPSLDDVTAGVLST